MMAVNELPRSPRKNNLVMIKVKAPGTPNSATTASTSSGGDSFSRGSPAMTRAKSKSSSESKRNEGAEGSTDYASKHRTKNMKMVMSSPVKGKKVAAADTVEKASKDDDRRRRRKEKKRTSGKDDKEDGNGLMDRYRSLIKERTWYNKSKKDEKKESRKRRSKGSGVCENDDRHDDRQDRSHRRKDKRSDNDKEKRGHKSSSSSSSSSTNDAKAKISAPLVSEEDGFEDVEEEVTAMPAMPMPAAYSAPRTAAAPVVQKRGIEKKQSTIVVRSTNREWSVGFGPGPGGAGDNRFGSFAIRKARNKSDKREKRRHSKHRRSSGKDGKDEKKRSSRSKDEEKKRGDKKRDDKKEQKHHDKKHRKPSSEDRKPATGAADKSSDKHRKRSSEKKKEHRSSKSSSGAENKEDSTERTECLTDPSSGSSSGSSADHAAPAANANAAMSTVRFKDEYKVGKQLGKGAFAVVYETRHRKTKKSYAVKKIMITDSDESELENIRLEIAIMDELKSYKHVVRLKTTFYEPEHIYVVMEKVKGGELFERLAKKEYYNEKEARDACIILFKTMNHCHKRRIAHRDLKPENLLLEKLDDDSRLKIADFGLAKKVPKDGLLKTFCGSPSYVAPEVINKKPYDCQCDVWSLGVIVYILLGGYSPFDDANAKKQQKKIVNADYKFHPQFWDGVSGDAKAFIGALLQPNPKVRLTCSQALKHKWMTASDDVLASQDLGTTQLELKKFNAKRKFRAAVKTLIAVNRLSFDY